MHQYVGCVGLLGEVTLISHLKVADRNEGPHVVVTHPPENGTTWPTMKSELFDARNSASSAVSSGLAIRRIGTLRCRCFWNR